MIQVAHSKPALSKLGVAGFFMAILTLFSQTGLAKDKADDTRPVYGLHENVHIQELGRTLPAKLDTGAISASLSARDIEEFEEDGEKKVSFKLALSDKRQSEQDDDKDLDKTITLPLEGHVRIKSRHEDTEDDDNPYNTRPVVKLDVCLADQKITLKTNLTNRTRFKYPLLVGSRGLQELNALIDPGQSYLGGEDPACKDSDTDADDKTASDEDED